MKVTEWSVSEARESLSEAIDHVQFERGIVVIVRRGKHAAALVPMEVLQHTQTVKRDSIVGLEGGIVHPGQSFVLKGTTSSLFYPEKLVLSGADLRSFAVVKGTGIKISGSAMAAESFRVGAPPVALWVQHPVQTKGEVVVEVKNVGQEKAFIFGQVHGTADYGPSPEFIR